MPKQRDITPLVRAVGTVIREHVGKAFRALADRVDGVEAKLAALPVPKDGRNAFEVAVSLGYEGTVHEWLDSLEGKAGASVTLEDIRPLVASAIKEVPVPKDGVDGKSVTLEDISPLISKAVGKLPLPKDGQSVTAEEIIPLVAPSLETKAAEVARQAVAELPKPKDGVDGKSVTTDDLLPIIKQWFDALPKPKDGTDGKSVALDDLRPMMESALATWALEFERRATDLMQRCIDRIPKPKNGDPGKDGIDALGFDDFEQIFDGKRTYTMRYTRGDQVKEFAFKIPSLIECGVFKEGQQYERGDGVTWGGSYWIAQTDTKSKPGDGNSDWRLAVKSGRNGKSAFDIARGNGFSGSEREWLDSLKDRSKKAESR
jgi:hypothetical protein